MDKETKAKIRELELELKSLKRFLRTNQTHIKLPRDFFRK